MIQLLLAFCLVFFLQTTRTFAEGECHSTSTSPGTVNVKSGEGVTLFDTNSAKQTGMKTPCEWTIKCSSSTDRIMFQTVGSMYRRAQSTGRYGLWSLYDPNDNNKYLGKTSFSHDQMVLLPHQSDIHLDA